MKCDLKYIGAGSGTRTCMSRNSINEEMFVIGTHLRKGMESLTILEPGKLRVPFGGGNKTSRKQSWMNVVQDTQTVDVSETVIEVPKLPKPQESSTEHCIEVHGWALAAGYALFSLGLGLCNLLAPQHTSRVCTASSPIPLLCLLLQSVVCLDRRYDRVLGSIGLVLSACAIPSACLFWSLYLSIPLVMVLVASVLCCMRQRDLYSWVCVCGACLALLFALPVPIQLLDPKWGMTVSVFFACALCFLAGMGVGRVGFMIKIF